MFNGGQTNLVNEFHSLENLAEDDMLPIQPRGWDSSDKLRGKSVSGLNGSCEGQERTN